MHLAPSSTSKSPMIALGDVIAERRFTLLESSGVGRLIWVRLGRPVMTDQSGVPQEGQHIHTFRCPFQITGLDCDDRVFAPFGEDPFVALQYAIHLVGDVIESGAKRLNLQNPRVMVRERANPRSATF